MRELQLGNRIQVKYDLAEEGQEVSLRASIESGSELCRVCLLTTPPTPPNPQADATVWWGATVKDITYTPDGRTIYRLLYDAYPEGGFDEAEVSCPTPGPYSSPARPSAA